MRRRRLALITLAASIVACTPAPGSSPTATNADEPLSTEIASLRPAAEGSPTNIDRYTWEQASIRLAPFTFLGEVADTPFGWLIAGTVAKFPDGNASFAPGEDPLDSLYQAAVWISLDGLSWTAQPGGSEFTGARVTNVVGSATGALMFGLRGICLPDACGGLPPNGGTVVWSTSDGRTWERLEGTGLADGAVVDVAATPTGFVAVGYVGDPEGKPDDVPFGEPTRAAMWRSSDGRHWEPVPNVPKLDRLTAVRSEGSMIMATGSTTEISTTVLSSDDGGVTWAAGSKLDEGCCPPPTIGAGRVVVAAPTDGDAAVINVSEAPFKSWSTGTPRSIQGIRPAWLQTMGISSVLFGWETSRDTDDMLVDGHPRTVWSQDGVAWVPATFPSAWDGQAAVSVATRGLQMVAILGPLESLNGPGDVFEMGVWLGKASE